MKTRGWIYVNPIPLWRKVTLPILAIVMPIIYTTTIPDNFVSRYFNQTEDKKTLPAIRENSITQIGTRNLIYHFQKDLSNIE